jgi:hypothetical protein
VLRYDMIDIANRIERKACWSSSTNLDPYSEGVRFEFLCIVGNMDKILLGFPQYFQATAGIVPNLGHGRVFSSSFLSRHSCIFLI